MLEAQFTKGILTFNLERMNEIQIYHHSDVATRQGFKTILAAPGHGEYGQFWSGPGIGLGYEDLKSIETHHILENLANRTEPEIDFVFAAKVNRVMDAVLESAKSGRWVDVKPVEI